jgi:cardiolipin synthase
MGKQQLSTFTYANQVELIRGGQEFFVRLKALIDEAEKTIYFQFYIFDGDDTGRFIADALKAAARRGVKIYMLVDAYASLGLSSSFVQELTDAGIHFRWFKSFIRHRRFYVGRRLHHKVVVVDSIKSFVCGLNVSDKYNDTVESIAWLDWAIFTEGTASLKLEQVCKRRIRDYSNDPDVPTEKVEKCAVRVCVNDWVGGKSEITRSYLQLLNEANSKVIIMSPYFMPGYQFRKSLRRAVKKGVTVQIILTGISDIWVSKYAERYLYDWLLRLGVEIYEYQRNVLHGKIVVSDKERVSVGSYNVNNLSAYASIELNLEIKNEEFAQKVDQQLTSIIRHECLQITEEIKNKKANIFNRLLQFLAYNFQRLMLLIFAFKQRG